MKTYVCNVENSSPQEPPLVAPSTAETTEPQRQATNSGALRYDGREEAATPQYEAPLLAPRMTFEQE